MVVHTCWCASGPPCTKRAERPRPGPREGDEGAPTTANCERGHILTQVRSRPRVGPPPQGNCGSPFAWTQRCTTCIAPCTRHTGSSTTCTPPRLPLTRFAPGEWRDRCVGPPRGRSPRLGGRPCAARARRRDASGGGQLPFRDRCRDWSAGFAADAGWPVRHRRRRDPRRALEAGHPDLPGHGLEVPAAAKEATVANVAVVPGEPRGHARVRGLLHGADGVLPRSVRVRRSGSRPSTHSEHQRDQQPLGRMDGESGRARKGFKRPLP